MARRAFRIPGLGKLNLKSPNTWLIAGAAGLGILWYLANSGTKTGIGFVDKAAGSFEDIYEDYIGPLGPAGAPVAAPPMAKGPAPMMPSKGLSFDDMVFSGAYAADAALPLTDWWTTSTSEDDRIIIA